MAADLKKARPDIVYLRRRKRRDEDQPKNTQAEAKPATGGIVMPPRPVKNPPAQASPAPSTPSSGISLGPRPAKNTNPSASSPAPSTSGGGINLSRPSSEAPAKQENTPAASTGERTSGISLKAPDSELQETKLPIPVLKGDIILGKDTNVVRLSKLQSAIGSLAMLNVAYAGWEQTDRSTGFLYANDALEASTKAVSFKDGKEHPPLPEVHTKSYGKRALVEFHRNALVVTLRHVKHLKRLVVVPEPGQDLVLGTLTGSSAKLPYKEGQVLYLSVVGNQVELRVEQFRGNIYETFRIGTYHPVTVSHPQADPATGSNDLQNFFSNVR